MFSRQKKRAFMKTTRGDPYKSELFLLYRFMHCSFLSYRIDLNFMTDDKLCYTNRSKLQFEFYEKDIIHLTSSFQLKCHIYATCDHQFFIWIVHITQVYLWKINNCMWREYDSSSWRLVFQWIQLFDKWYVNIFLNFKLKPLRNTKLKKYINKIWYYPVFSPIEILL